MHGPSVLVIDDDPDSRIICSLVLGRGGYEVLLAESGPEGVRMAREARPSVVLMDLALPGLDGWEATEQLRSDPRTAEIPVVVFTARVLETDQARSRRMGCAGYLVKPASPQQILSMVHGLVPPAPEGGGESR